MMIVIAASHSSSEGSVMNAQTNTTDQSENQHESTYALLIRSEEKSRNVIEMAIYPILILGAVIAIWQFVLQTVDLPSIGTKAALRVTSTSGLHVRPAESGRGI